MITLGILIGFTALLIALVATFVGLITTKYPTIQNIVVYLAPACIVTAAVTIIPALMALIWQAP